MDPKDGRRGRRNSNQTDMEQRSMQLVLSYMLTLGEILLLLLRILVEICVSIVKKFLPATEKSVENEIILITGTGHGIGRELALQYAALGAVVVCWDVNADSNQQTVREIKNLGRKAFGYQCDVCNREQIMEVARKVEKEVGKVTVLVNNAGIMPIHRLLDHTTAEIKKIFDVNVFAHFWLLQAFLPNMLANNHGHVVGISSVAGICGLKYIVPYCASKYAVRGLMESLSEELRETIPNSQVKFTTICPYMVDTGLCKVPRVKFPKILSPLPQKMVATEIIKAMRRNVEDTTIPSYLMSMNYYFRLFPENVPRMIKDFMDSSLQLEHESSKAK